MPTAGPETFLEILENFLGRQIDWNSSLITQLVKNTPAKQKTRVQFLDWGDPLEKEMATPSTTLAWRIPWREKPTRLHSMGSQESDMTERLSTLWQYSLKAEATGKYSYYYSLYTYFLHFNFFVIVLYYSYFYLLFLSDFVLKIFLNYFSYFYWTFSLYCNFSMFCFFFCVVFILFLTIFCISIFLLYFDLCIFSICFHPSFVFTIFFSFDYVSMFFLMCPLPYFCLCCLTDLLLDLCFWYLISIVCFHLWAGS